MQERLQKILAKAGITSRRKAEELIQLGEVTVNGRIAKIGDKADLAQDAIKVQGKLLQSAEPHVYLAFYKPRAVISMFADPEGRPTLADYLRKVHARLFPIGRLDFNSEGLLLLTNDGEIAEKLNRLDSVARTYEIKVKGHPDSGMLARLEKGSRIGNRLVKPHSVSLPESYSSKSRIRLVLVGSGAVDIKSFVEAKGFLVERLTRTAIGHITAHGMQPGEYRFLTKSQMQSLLDQPELGMKLADEDVKEEQIRREREAEKLQREALREASESGAVSGESAEGEERPARGGARKPFGRKPFGAKREGGFGGKREGGFGGKREGGFGGKREGGFGAKREGGFGAKREGGFGAKREGGFGGKREGGFGGKREGGFAGKREGGFAGKREGGFGGKREGGFGGKREGGFGGKREGGFGGKREGGFGGKREGGFGGKREGGFGGKREGGFGGKREGGFGGKREGGFGGSRAPRGKGFGASRGPSKGPRGPGRR
ncbi:MAG: pseudouridine synthase [Oligoflexia bacterium]|nr:pseudouridine synthase [Oligoflexia bacterium]